MKSSVAKLIPLVLMVALLVLVGMVATNAGATTITDDFNTAHNYSGGSVTGTIWDGVLNTGAVSVLDANTTTTGRLRITLAGSNVGFGNPGSLATAPFLYKNVSGDFDAKVQVYDQTSGNYSAAYLMARVGVLADAGAGEDSVAAMSERHSFGNLMRTRVVDNDAGTDGSNGTMYAWPNRYIRLERIGDTFTAYNSGDGLSWTSLGSFLRTDMTGLPVQVGLVMTNFSSGTFFVEFENFSVTTADSAVPEPSTYALGLIGLVGLGFVALRKKVRRG